MSYESTQHSNMFSLNAIDHTVNWLPHYKSIVLAPVDHVYTILLYYYSFHIYYQSLGIYLSKEKEKCLERHLQILYDFHKMQMFTKINQIIYVIPYPHM